MIARVLEAFFRHTLLIVLPMITIPFVVGVALYAIPPQYEAQAGMWVEQATYLTHTDDVNRYLSPALNQKNRLLELMQTRTFLFAIAGKTSLVALTTAPGGYEQLAAMFATDFDASAVGDHLLVLRFRSEQRDTALNVLTTLVEEFKSRYAADRYGQARVAISFYEARLSEAEAQLVSARSALAKYLAANPSVATALTTSGLDAARVNVGFAEAQRAVDVAQRGADSARDSLERAKLDVSAGAQSFDLGFRLTDAPQTSQSASRQLKKLLLYPVAAIVLAIALSASLLALFTLSDRSVRSLADLGPDAVIIGVLPHLRVIGVTRRPGPAIARRAVGFVAGAIVPLRGLKGGR